MHNTKKMDPYSLLPSVYCGYRGRGVELTIHVHLGPRLRMAGTKAHFHNSWRGAQLSSWYLMMWCLVKQRYNLHNT